MAIWTTTIGAPTEGSADIQWDVAALLDAALVESGGAAYLRILRLTLRPDLNRAIVNIWTSDSTTESPSPAGPHLSSSWEGFATAIIVEAGDLTLTLSGPTHSDVVFADTTEPYFTSYYAYGTTTADSISDFYTAFPELTDAQKAATTLTLRDELPDLMPTFGTGDIPDQTYTQNTAISALQLPAATGGDGTLAYSITGEPSGVTLNASRQLVGTPTATGTFNVTFTVTDADGDTDTIDFTITVNAADLMPSLPAIADQTATVGTAFSLTFSAATGGDPPLTYSVSGNPSWLSLSGRTLSGTPDSNGHTHRHSHRSR